MHILYQWAFADIRTSRPLGDLSLFLYRKKRDSSADCSSFLSRSYCVLTLEYITAIHMGCQCSKDVISRKINVVEFSSKLYALGLRTLVNIAYVCKSDPILFFTFQCQIWNRRRKFWLTEPRLGPFFGSINWFTHLAHRWALIKVA